MTCADLTVHRLIEGDDNDDDYFDMREVTQEPTAEEKYEYRHELEMEQIRKQQEEYKKQLQHLVNQAKAGDFNGITPQHIKDEPTILPPEYWQAKKRMAALVKSEVGPHQFIPNLSPNVRYNISSDPPRIVIRRRRRKKSYYLAGFEWVWEHLPREIEIYIKYRPLQGGRILSGEWKSAHDRIHAKRHRAYNLDDPELAESLWHLPV